jgi:hypothetical protein
MLVSFRGARPVIANLLLDGVHGADVFTAGDAQPGRIARPRGDHRAAARRERALHEGEQRFTLHNDSDRPITVHGRFPPGPHFRVAPSEVVRTLAPGASESLAVKLTASEPIP